MEQRPNLNDETHFYKGRFIIHRDSEIDGGVYLSEGAREAVVVDSNKYSGLNKLYSIINEEVNVNGIILKGKILKAVYNTVNTTMPNHNDEVICSLMNMLNVRDGGKISLDFFIRNGIGSSRHLALTCGALIEKFKNQGLLRGNVSIDKNVDKENNCNVWCRYTSYNGIVTILDVARDYFGLIGNYKTKCNYKRPEDSLKNLYFQTNDS